MYQNIFVEYDRENKNTTVHLWDDEMGYQQIPYKEFSYAYVPDPNGTYLSLYGQRVKKTRRYKHDGVEVMESDLPAETRVLTDLYLNSDEPSVGHKLVIIDIEVSARDGLPDVDTADNEITSIAMEDRLTGTEYVFILDPDGIALNYDADDHTVVESCPDEETLLSSFLDIWEQISPTIVTGWNIDYFDIPYLYRRISSVLSADDGFRLSPIGIVHWRKNQRKYRVAGISLLDYLDLYRKFTYTEQPNYRLDTIGQIEVGMGKIEYEGSLDDLFENDIEKFLIYNLHDVRIVSAIDQKKKLIDLIRGICTVGHVPYEDYSYSSRWLEGALITDLHRRNIIAPNKDPRAQEKMRELDASGDKGFIGAYVKAPLAGRYEWVYSLDLQSLYPSIIMSLNISPETKIGRVVNWDIEKHAKREIGIYKVQDPTGDSDREIDRETFVKFMESGEMSISSNGIIYRTDRPGLLPDTLNRWFAERIEYKDKMKKAADDENVEQQEYWSMRQHIQKIFLNSLYGVLGLPIFRFYDLDNALAVTATGQDVIKTSARFVNQIYNEKLETEGVDYCIYIDTDSLYFSSMPLMTGGMDTQALHDNTVRMARNIEDRLNQFYQRMGMALFYCPPEKNRLVIKGETVASAGFWVQKKRYALRQVYDLETDQPIRKVTVKGLDVVRSSFPAAFRTFMKEILTDILDATPQEIVKQKILTFKSDLPNMPIADVARNTAVKNMSKWVLKNPKLGEFKKSTPAHVKAAFTYNELIKLYNQSRAYAPITNGTKIKWVYLKDNPHKIDAVAFIGDDSDCPEITKLIDEYIDYDKAFNLEFSRKLQDFYNALGWGLIPTEVNQNADQFFDFGG